MSPDSTPQPQLKRCAKCGEAKSLDAFGKCSRREDGLQTQCKVCIAPEAKKARQKYNESHRDKNREYSRNYREAHAEQVRAYQREYGPKYYAAHKPEPKRGRPNNDTHRTCTKCGKSLPISAEYFYPKKTGKYGFTAACRDCTRAQVSEYTRNSPNKIKDYIERNADAIKAKYKVWYAANRDKKLEYRRERREHYLELSKIYSAKNKDAIREKNRAYRATDQGKKVNLAKEHRRRARVRQTGGSFSAQDIDALRVGQTDKQGRVRCWWCDKPMKKWHIDHRIPISKGGHNNPGNLCLACPNCNLSKHDHLPSDWAGRLL